MSRYAEDREVIKQLYSVMARMSAWPMNGKCRDDMHAMVHKFAVARIPDCSDSHSMSQASIAMTAIRGIVL